MLPILEELSAHESKQANEIHYCSELKPFLIKLNVRIFPIQSRTGSNLFLLGTETFHFCLNLKCTGLIRGLSNCVLSNHPGFNSKPRKTWCSTEMLA